MSSLVWILALFLVIQTELKSNVRKWKLVPIFDIDCTANVRKLEKAGIWTLQKHPDFKHLKSSLDHFIIEKIV